jgi:hypothetical protein
MTATVTRLASYRDSFLRLRPWDARAAAALPAPRLDEREYQHAKWRRHPHEAVALKARESMGFGENVA